MFSTFFKFISNYLFKHRLCLSFTNFRKKLSQLFSNNIVESSTRYIINLNIV